MSMGQILAVTNPNVNGFVGSFNGILGFAEADAGQFTETFDGGNFAVVDAAGVPIWKFMSHTTDAFDVVHAGGGLWSHVFNGDIESAEAEQGQLRMLC